MKAANTFMKKHDISGSQKDFWATFLLRSLCLHFCPRR